MIVALVLLGHKTSHPQNELLFSSCAIYYCCRLTEVSERNSIRVDRSYSRICFWDRSKLELIQSEFSIGINTNNSALGFIRIENTIQINASSDWFRLIRIKFGLKWTESDWVGFFLNYLNRTRFRMARNSSAIYYYYIIIILLYILLCTLPDVSERNSNRVDRSYSRICFWDW